MDIGRRLKPRERNVLVLLLIAFSAFGVFDHSLWAPNDSREGAMIWDMFRSGNWTKLSLNGTPFLEKPPLLHWTALFFCELFGRIHEGWVRLPAALYGCGALLIVVHWGRALGRERAGLLGAFLCATTLLYAEYSRIVLTDICLTFMVTLALHAFYLAHSAKSGKTWRYAVFLLVSALSFYAKGVLGPGLVLVSVTVFLALRREWKLAILLPVIFAPILAAVVAPWALALYREGGREYLVSVFIDNQLGRFFALPRGNAVTSLPLVGRFLGFMADRPIPPDPYFVHKEPLYFYLVKLPQFWMPWTLLVPPALWYWFKRGAGLASPLAALLRVAFVTILVVLHVSSAKVACYALPLYPILFLMVGVWCDDVLVGPVHGFASWMERLTSALVKAILFVLPGAYLILIAISVGGYRHIEAWLRGLGFESVSLGDPALWIRDPDRAGNVRGAVLCVVALAVAFLALRWVRASTAALDRAGGLMKLAAAFTVVLMLSLSAAMPAYDRQRTYKPAAALVKREIDAGRRVALAVGRQKDVGEFTYYADTRLPEVTLIPGVREFLEEGPEPRGVVVRVEDLEAVRAALGGLEHEVRAVPADAGVKSKAFRLITRG